MAKKIDITLYDNLDCDFDAFKESYQECYELTDEEMAEISDTEIWEFINDTLDLEWDDLLTNLKYSKNADKPCVITGSLGLWYGRPNIEPLACEDIESAIRKCVNNMDYVVIKQVNGHLEVRATHHDGSNHFEIHILNDKGIRAKELIEEGKGDANLSCRCYHKSLNGYLF